MNLAALLCYIAAEAFAVAHIRRDRDALGTATTVLLLLGFIIHFGALVLGAKATQTVPYNTLPGSMSLFAWMLVGAYGVLLLIHREVSTGPFLIPLAILFLAVSLLMGTGRPLMSDPRLSGPLFAWHVTIAIFGYATLTLTFVLAQLYLIQMRQLHRRTMGLLFARLPALDVVWGLHRSAALLGVVALSVATVLGLIWARQNWRTFWDAKVAFTLVMIGIYIFTLLAPRLGLGGKRTAWVSIGGYGLLIFSYTVVNLFITAEHVFR
ncbi:MAG: cytochrome c biogenesis protein CcsA [Acidobacteria bacterium]|nr:cytochrome c biogenesis protein CcsA [Acidobacteriota bacterium]